MREAAETLDGILAAIWSELGLAATDTSHPFRIVAVATVGEIDPSVRNVILRAARPGERELEFHTDRRSSKVARLRLPPLAEWAFYDAGSQIQVRAMTMIRVHFLDEIAERRWSRVPAEAQARYATTHPPGAVVSDWTEGNERSGSGWENFAVVIGTVRRLDYLRLRPDGHRRAQFTWSATADTPVATWVAP